MHIHGDSDPDTDPVWLRSHEGVNFWIQVRTQTMYLSHACGYCDSDNFNLDSEPDTRVNTPYGLIPVDTVYSAWIWCTLPRSFL